MVVAKAKTSFIYLEEFIKSSLYMAHCCRNSENSNEGDSNIADSNGGDSNNSNIAQYLGQFGSFLGHF